MIHRLGILTLQYQPAPGASGGWPRRVYLAGGLRPTIEGPAQITLKVARCKDKEKETGWQRAQSPQCTLELLKTSQVTITSGALKYCFLDFLVPPNCTKNLDMVSYVFPDVGFPKIGVPLVIIHFNGIFPL